MENLAVKLYIEEDNRKEDKPPLEVEAKDHEEAKLNAQGLKKAIEKNQQLSEENSRLVEQCKKMKAFMNRGKLALDRAKETQVRVHELEDEVEELKLDLKFFKDQHQMNKFQFTSMEEILVESALSQLIGEAESSASEFLLANIENDSCRRLLHLSRSLGPLSRRTLALAAKIKSLEKDNEQLQLLLCTAQGEAKLLSDQIGYLLEEQTTSDGGNGGGIGKPPAGSSSPKVHERKRALED
ncbi:uncharacterized protein LOC120076121 [Benincasa hispida]|uniref:uncharacterized protein LOC120076121 n=1 Tax=Benincasa hispida TaxID=102211 RepID=UPI001902A2EB|nr:uncharacterized protein LOC120076121 [Benincasa hispida]